LEKKNDGSEGLSKNNYLYHEKNLFTFYFSFSFFIFHLVKAERGHGLAVPTPVVRPEYMEHKEYPL